ncbi:MAG: tryptophan-rich sensory protein [Leptolyngbyaceae cyanobacterium RM1_405_57]|nr:tryptophan-rich sensory protein [Leptolyngbyaceae cyanobacterium RM1_405_57]
MKISSSNHSGIGLAIATLTAILATLTINALSNFFPPQGLNIGEIANTVLQGVQITPANYAFSIWGLIYLGLITYGIYQLHPSRRTEPRIRRASRFLIVACIAQIIWVYLFTTQLFWPSVVAMLGILLSLIAAYLQLGIGQIKADKTHKWQAFVPFSIYLGWISVATVVNVASALYSVNWTGWGISDVGWTVIMLIVSAAIAAIVTVRRTDIAFTLVFVWAYVAIAIRQLNIPAIWITAIVGAIALLALLTLLRVRQFNSANK